MIHPKILFILRARDDAWGQHNPNSYNSSGLLNSAKFIRDMLLRHGFEAKLVQVVDSNDIDREVFRYNPDVVVLEAIWCPPSKLRELTSLHHHKHRKWIIRNHSELPFLSFEGIAMEWLLEYATIRKVFVACNSPVAAEEIEHLVRVRSGHHGHVLYLPNYYPTHDAIIKHRDHNKRALDVGCFGAIRPLKNTFEQAIASIIFAHSIDEKLRFHINSTRIEGNAEPILMSVRTIFNNTPNCEMIEEPWLEREEFLKLCERMDIGLQVSYSETFNIVAADLITRGVPVVC